jgi:hypothetical protein
MKHLYLFLLLFAHWANAQQYIQIEKRNSTKVRRFQVGDAISYKTKNDLWKHEVIERIIPENQLFITSNGMVKIEHITKLRRERYWTKVLEKSAYSFALGWVFWNSVTPLVDRDEKLTKGDFIFASTVAGTGFVIRKVFKYRKYKMGEKHRLRIVDLDFSDRKKRF